MIYNVLDLFSGAGGFSLGFEQAGFNIVGAVEWDKHAMASHQYNFKETTDILGDITKISDEEILSKYNGKNIDVIIAGPSCQSFSSANRTQDPYSEEAKSRNRLFFEVLRFSKLLGPKVVVIENVPQILTKDKGFAKEAIYKYMQDLGYTTTVKVLIATYYGVPEYRKRAFFVSIKGDEEFDFDTVEKHDIVTVYDALSDLYEQPTSSGCNAYVEEPKTDYQKLMREGSTELCQHTISRHNEDVLKRLASIPQGGNWQDIPEELREGVKFDHSKTHSSSYRRLHEEEPSYTITSKLGQGHPIQTRRISIREAARIQSFPDRFIFQGPRSKQALQIGNAVPPLLAQALAKAILEKISK